MHGELGQIWRDIDADPVVSAAILQGEGGAFSAGGDFKMIERMMEDFDTAPALEGGARPGLQHHQLLEAGGQRDAWPRGRCRPGVRPAGRYLHRQQGSAPDRWPHPLGVAAGDHAAIVWPLLCGMAKAKYYLLLCDPLTGAEAERIGLISLAVEDAELDAKAVEIATRLAEGAPNAIRWTKYALNNWLRQAGPIFDTSLALEFMGFTGPEAKEGVAAFREKRKPQFPTHSPL